jgi:hypothetical protein
MSTACSNVSLDIGHGESWIQTVVPSCHAPDQRFPSTSDDFSGAPLRDVNPFQPAFRFFTSYQCSHGKASLLLFSCLELAFDRCCSATTPVARRRNLVAEFLATYIFWPVAFAMAFACALMPIATLIIGGALSVVPLFMYFLFFLPLKSCWAWCGGESPSAALSPNSSYPDSGVAMVNIAELPHSDSGLEPSSDTTNTLQESDTAFSTTRVTMTDDELSPLITRHIEASARELRSQMQEMNARSLRTEAQLGELLARGYSNSLPH